MSGNSIGFFELKKVMKIMASTSSEPTPGDVWSTASIVVFVIGIALFIASFVSNRKGAGKNEKVA